MKTCFVCGVQMQDADNLCPTCGADYMQAVINDISGGSTNADARLMLNNLEEGFARLDRISPPTLGDSLRKMLPSFYLAGFLFFLLAGILTGANIFYLLAVAILIPLLLALFGRIRGRQRLCPGEVLICATKRVFDEDAAVMRERFGKQTDVMTRLNAMQERIDEMLEEQGTAHKNNRKKIVLVGAILLILCCVGVAALTVRNHAARKSMAAYAMQPEWVKLQDRYLAEVGADEAADQNLRQQVVEAMLSADQPAAAEAFFFTHSQGKVGDVDCAAPIARYYKNKPDAEALEAFVASVKLRYDSDTSKVKSIK